MGPWHALQPTATTFLATRLTPPNPHPKTSLQSCLPDVGKANRQPVAEEATPSPAPSTPPLLGSALFSWKSHAPPSLGHTPLRLPWPRPLPGAPFSEPRPLRFGRFPGPASLGHAPPDFADHAPAPPSPAGPSPYLVSGGTGGGGGGGGSWGAGRGGRGRNGRVRGGQLWARCGGCGRSGALGTMALCARGALLLLLLLLGALQVLALLGTAARGADPQGSSRGNDSVPLLTSSANMTENTTVASNQTSEVNSSTVTSGVPRSVSVVTVTPATIAKISTPGVSPHMTPTASNATPKASASPNSTHTSTALMTTGHSSLKTSITITTTLHPDKSKGSKFDAGSFVGGIVLTLGVLSVLYIGCKMYYSRRGIRYRSIEEHDAII
ncbi:porimin [Phodopus roborovskii]|uniref:porimin n=1 Tax=Phodopus roborovskii TaxID=109678 RepID=UPI0021E3E5FC|nr:porimin [Phodopus roborovskii]